MKNKSFTLLTALLFTAYCATAQNFYYKADNSVALNLAGSWTNNTIPPTASDWAVWDANVATPANCTNENLGAATSWGGIMVLNPSAAVDITNSSTLTLGDGTTGLGIDMAETSSVQDLYLACPVTTSGAQVWNIGSGRTLNFALSNQAVVVGGDLVINGNVKFNSKEFRIGTSTISITNPGTTLDFSPSVTAGCAFTVGFSGSGSVVTQSVGTVNLYKNSTSTGALLLGGEGSTTGGPGTYNISGGVLQDTNKATADYFSIGDGSGQTGTLNVYGGSVNVPQIQVGNDGFGIVNIYDGKVTTPGGDLEICKGSSALASSVSVYGGTLSIPGHNLAVGYKGLSGFGSGTLYLTNPGIIYIGTSLQVPAGNSGSSPGFFTNDGGNIIASNSVTLLTKGAGSGTITLNSGTLSTKSVTMGTGTGVGVLNLNGGTLAPLANSSTFIANTNFSVDVLPGGAVINNAGFNITIPAALVNGTGGSPDGGLLSLGNGTLTLAGDNSYNGPTTVGAGTLTIGTTNLAGGTILPGSAAIVVTNGTLNTLLTTNGTTLVCSNLVLVNSGGSNVLQFSCGTNSDPVVPLIDVTNDIMVNGTVTVNVDGTGLSVGVVPLIQYNGTVGGGGTFALGVLEGGLGYITNNTAAHQIQAVILGSGAVLGWRALINTNWDAVTSNWWELSNNVAAAFSSGANVFFDDTTTNSLVNVTTTVVPFGVTFNNNSSNYVFGGGGGISGFGGVAKLGAGSVTMGISNSYAGLTAISNGVFTLGANNAIPSTSDTAVEGKLDLAGFSTGVLSLNGNNGIVDNSGSSPVALSIGNDGGTFSGLITNSGGGALTLAKISGSSLLLLNPNNGYSGGTTNAGGLLELASERSIGTGPLAFGGGNLAWTPADTNPHTLTVGVIVGGSTTFGNTNGVNGPLTISGTVNLAGATPTFTCDEDVLLPNGVTNGVIANKAGPNKLVLMNSTNLLLNATPRVSQGDWVVTNNCIIGVNGDNFRIEASVDFALAEVDVYPGCQLLLTNHNSGDIDVGAEDVTGGTGVSNILNISGLVEVQGGGDPSHGALRIGNPTDAEDYVNLLPGGVLHVNWVNPTAPNVANFNFNGGTLRVFTNDNASTFMQGLGAATVLDGGAIIDTAGFTNITVGQSLAAGGTGIGGLTKVGLGTLLLNNNDSYTGPTLVSAGGLGGDGTIASAVTVAAGASLLAGSSTNIGTFTINNTVRFNNASSAVMKVDKISGVTSSDNIGGVTTLNYAGTLVVTTNVDMTDVFAAGDTFTLFSANTYNGSFASYSLPALPAGLTWNTSQLAVNGSISVVTAPAAPAFASVSLQNGNIVITGTNGTSGGSYSVLVSTNLSLPLMNWTAIATNQFDVSGNFSFTNAISPSSPRLFFDVQLVP